MHFGLIDNNYNVINEGLIFCGRSSRFSESKLPIFRCRLI